MATELSPLLALLPLLLTPLPPGPPTTTEAVGAFVGVVGASVGGVS